MGNISCCQPDAGKLGGQQLIIGQDYDSKLSGAIDLINLLQQQIENHFFIDYKHQLGIQAFIGINVENLSSFHQFIKEMKLRDLEASISKLSQQQRLKSLSHIHTQCEATVDQIKTALFELKKNTKNNLKPLDLNQTKNQNNSVDTPYFLPWIHTQNKKVCLYIGQWKYQSRYLMRNFPSGYGRLYINDEVWEGEMHLCIQKPQDFSHSTIEFICEELNSPFKNTRQKINIIKNHFTLELNGYGRKFTRDDEYCGEFEKGLLNGKGQYKNHPHDYSYEGNWVNSMKNGKGIEQTRTTKYQGQWKDGKKNGQGTLIFYISPQQQKQRQKEQKIFDDLNQNNKQYRRRMARVTIQMNLQEISDKEVRATLNKNLQKYKGEELLTFENKHTEIWQIKGFPLVNRSFLQNLKFQQLMKTNFLQKYVGQFAGDQFHGKGMYQWVKGNFYVGDWVEGKMEGLGKFFWKQGYVYYGQYKNDLKHGKGEMKWDPYKRHRGNWAFGKKHGYGEQIKIILDQNQSLQVVITSGLWKNNNLDQKNIYFQKCFFIENDPNYINFSSILKHNYFLYHADTKLSQQIKVKLIHGEAKNYFNKPCRYCGSYIRKQQNPIKKGILQGMLDFHQQKVQDKKTNEEQEVPQNCEDCSNKLKQLKKIRSDQKRQDKGIS